MWLGLFHHCLLTIKPNGLGGKKKSPNFCCEISIVKIYLYKLFPAFVSNSFKWPLVSGALDVFLPQIITS